MEITGSPEDAQDTSTSEDASDRSFLDTSTVAMSTKYEQEKDQTTTESSSQEGNNLSRKETQAVSRLRRIVITVLIVSTTAVAVGVYYYLRKSEINHFEDAFTTDANSIISGVATGVARTLQSVDALAVNIVSYAEVVNATFPFVTLPHYAVQGHKAMKQAPYLYVEPFYHVTNDQREEWEEYSYNNSDWILEAREVQRADDTYFGYIPDSPIHREKISSTFGPMPPSPEKGFMPAWQIAPLTADHLPYNWDFYSPLDTRAIDSLVETRKVILMETGQLPDPDNAEEVAQTEAWTELWYSNFVGPDQDPSEPVSGIYFPILTSNKDQARADYEDPGNFVGGVSAGFYWATMIRNILLPGKNGMVVVFDNPCNPTFTYEINGPDSKYLGRGDLHDPTYDHMMVSSTLLTTKTFENFNKSYTGVPLNEEFCPYTFRVYPSKTVEDQYLTNSPMIITIVAALLFAASSGVFLIYDLLVEQRQKKILNTAVRTGALVSTLFPANVRDQLLDEAGGLNEVTQLEAPNKKRLRSFLSGDSTTEENTTEMGSSQKSSSRQLTMYKQKPIAELFPETTIMFADIVGFTAWSSTREPSQVFMLLETIYRSFDEAANLYKVFKVETVGDCYVAVAGVPDHRSDHAVVMARFARECVKSLRSLVKRLEVMLGPDTADITMRFGMHSGPVTAGVLRGERSRFQLFGDTMNVASRMESTGIPNRVQISEVTANLLMQAGKGIWIKPRPDNIEVKGKGMMKTFWLHVNNTKRSSSKKNKSQMDACTDDTSASSSVAGLDNKHSRLVDWVVEVLSSLLKQIKAKRDRLALVDNTSSHHKPNKGNSSKKVNFAKEHPDLPDIPRMENQTVLDEVQEIVRLPNFDGIATDKNADNVKLDEDVEEQLKDYVRAIASLYHDNPFHNFEHASHVTMSVVKLMSRIVAPDLSKETCTVGEIASKLHDHTYGITSDPLTQFACAFSALIHDTDHPGVPNTRFIEENPEMAKMYRERSVAEQNSVDLAWNLLMTHRFAELRRAIYGTDIETQHRFRQLVVNSVMATDIMDKDLKDLRNKRWDKAFNPEDDCQSKTEPAKDAIDRKATIVIEHLIQASDVAHTMQHWHIYRKWNERLFCEMYKAYVDGRAEKNPAEFWYKGEIGFLDYYVIPLAKKLKECGVFGVSSAEYLNYAQQNREEWESRGQEMVEGMVKSLQKGKTTIIEEPENFEDSMEIL